MAIDTSKLQPLVAQGQSFLETAFNKTSAIQEYFKSATGVDPAQVLPQPIVSLGGAVFGFCVTAYSSTVTGFVGVPLTLLLSGSQNEFTKTIYGIGLGALVGLVIRCCCNLEGRAKPHKP